MQTPPTSLSSDSSEPARPLQIEPSSYAKGWPTHHSEPMSYLSAACQARRKRLQQAQTELDLLVQELTCEDTMSLFDPLGSDISEVAAMLHEAKHALHAAALVMDDATYSIKDVKILDRLQRHAHCLMLAGKCHVEAIKRSRYNS